MAAKSFVLLMALAVVLPAQASYEQALAAEKAGDRAGAVRGMTECANAGEARCMRAMGRMSRPAGDSPSGDWRQAMRWYQMGASRGDALSARGVAEVYLNGLGVEADPSQAMQWFRTAAEAGDHGSLLTLSEAHVYGVGVSRDVVLAAALVKRASDFKVDGADAESRQFSKYMSQAALIRVDRLVSDMSKSGKVTLASSSGPTSGPYLFATPVIVQQPGDLQHPSGLPYVALGLHPSSPVAAASNACQSVDLPGQAGAEDRRDSCIYSEQAITCAQGGYFAVAEGVFGIGSTTEPSLDMLDHAFGLACGKPNQAAAREAALSACTAEFARRSPTGMPRPNSAADDPLSDKFSCTVRAAGRNDGLFNGVAYDATGALGGQATEPRGMRRFWCWGAERTADRKLANDDCLP